MSSGVSACGFVAVVAFAGHSGMASRLLSLTAAISCEPGRGSPRSPPPPGHHRRRHVQRRRRQHTSPGTQSQTRHPQTRQASQQTPQRHRPTTVSNTRECQTRLSRRRSHLVSHWIMKTRPEGLADLEPRYGIEP